MKETLMFLMVFFLYRYRLLEQSMATDGLSEEQVTAPSETVTDRLCCSWLGCCVLIKFSSFYGDTSAIFVLGAFTSCASILFCDR